MASFTEYLASISRTPEEIEEEKEQRKREADRTEIERLAPILLRIITRNIEEKAKSGMYSLVNGQRRIAVDFSFSVLLKYTERRLPDPFVTCKTISVKRGRGCFRSNREARETVHIEPTNLARGIVANTVEDLAKSGIKCTPYLKVTVYNDHGYGRGRYESRTFAFSAFDMRAPWNQKASLGHIEREVILKAEVSY